MTNLPDEGAPNFPAVPNVVLLQEIGRGSSSVVFLAEHLILKSKVAVKISLPNAALDPSWVGRFQREAQTLSKIDHPAVLKIHAFHVAESGAAILVTEYVDGQNLQDFVDQQGPLEPEKACQLTLSLLAALSEVHKSGVLHRDLKPSNIIITKTGEPKIIDFGLAKIYSTDKALSHNLTASNQMIGSPAYMSPEQCMSKPATAASDIYSLACLFYFLLRGQPPFVGASDMAVMQEHISSKPGMDLLPVSGALKGLISQALSKTPDLRPSSCEQFAHALAKIENKSSRLPGRVLKLLVPFLLILFVISISFYLVQLRNKRSKAVYPLGPTYLEKARRMAELQRDLTDASTAKNERQFEKAISLYKRILLAPEAKQSRKLQLNAMHDLSLSYAESKNYKKALEVIRDAANIVNDPHLKIYASTDNLSDQRRLIAFQSLVCRIYIDWHKYAEALAYQIAMENQMQASGIDPVKDLNISLDVISFRLKRGEIYRALGEFTKARDADLAVVSSLREPLYCLGGYLMARANLLMDKYLVGTHSFENEFKDYEDAVYECLEEFPLRDLAYVRLHLAYVADSLIPTVKMDKFRESFLKRLLSIYFKMKSVSGRPELDRISIIATIMSLQKRQSVPLDELIEIANNYESQFSDFFQRGSSDIEQWHLRMGIVLARLISSSNNGRSAALERGPSIELPSRLALIVKSRELSSRDANFSLKDFENSIKLMK